MWDSDEEPVGLQLAASKVVPRFIRGNCGNFRQEVHEPWRMASTPTIIRPLESQVGGHAGVSTSENGALLIKPAVPTELEFYRRLQQDNNLEDLRAFTPTFLGTLELIGRFDEARSAVSESIVVEPVVTEEKDKYLVLFLSFLSFLQFSIQLFFFYIHNPLF